MNAIDILLLLALAAALGLALRRVIRQRRSGGCGCGCPGCTKARPACGGPHATRTPHRPG